MIKELQETLDQAVVHLNIAEQKALNQIIKENLQNLLTKARSRNRSQEKEKIEPVVSTPPSQVKKILQGARKMESFPDGFFKRLNENVKEFRENFAFRNDQEDP